MTLHFHNKYLNHQLSKFHWILIIDSNIPGATWYICKHLLPREYLCFFVTLQMRDLHTCLVWCMQTLGISTGWAISCCPIFLSGSAQPVFVRNSNVPPCVNNGGRVAIFNTDRTMITWMKDCMKETVSFWNDLPYISWSSLNHWPDHFCWSSVCYSVVLAFDIFICSWWS